MLYLLYGDDTFTIRETLSSMKQEVGPPDLRDVNVTVLDGDQATFDRLTATCDTVPFMAEKRLVVMQGLLSRFERRTQSRAPRAAGGDALGEWKGLPDYLTRVPGSTDLVFVEGPLAQANPLLSAIRPYVKARTFRVPRAGELRQWIRRRAAAGGIDIEPRAVDTLAEAIGGDLGVINTELQKLSLYRWGHTVRHEDVEELVSYSKEANIFEAVDAMMEGRPELAIRLVHRLLQSGRPPSYVLAMMARQVRLLILAKELRSERVPFDQQGKRLGLAGYPLRKTLDQEKMFSAERLLDVHRKLLEADVMIKTTGTDEELVLDVLIAEVSTGRAAGVRRAAGP